MSDKLTRNRRRTLRRRKAWRKLRNRVRHLAHMRGARDGA